MLRNDAIVVACGRPDFQSRFWAKVNKDGPNGCWIWTGSRHRFGYGSVGVTSSSTDTAHRVSWTMANGRIPDGKHVLHDCPGGNDNPACLNPAHLWIGTQAENTHDMDRKGRRVNDQPRGEKCGRSKLTEVQVREILARYSAGEKRRALAAEFGVTSENLAYLFNGTTWTNVERPAGMPPIRRYSRRKTST